MCWCERRQAFQCGGTDRCAVSLFFVRHFYPTLQHVIMATGDVCTYDPETSPYRYYHKNGTTATTGHLVSVEGYSAPVCVFTASACRPDQPLSSVCCETTKRVDREADVNVWMLVAFLVPYLGFQIWKRYSRQKLEANKKRAETAEAAVRKAESQVRQAKNMLKAAEEKRQATGSKPANLADEALYRAEVDTLQKAHRENLAALETAKEARRKAKEDNNLPIVNSPTKNIFLSSLPTNLTRNRLIVIAVLFVLASTAGIYEKLIMKKSIQTTLSPTDRAAQMAMDAVLTPVGEVFAFLEDTMTVKVGYALAAGRHGELNALLNISVFGGLLCSIAAFGLISLVTLNESVSGAVLNPSETSNEVLIARGCTWIPTTQALLVHAKEYWLLTAAAWVPSFISSGIIGFFVGTVDLPPMLISQMVNLTVPIGIWFGLLNGTQIYPLTILALAYTVPQFVTTVAQFIYLGCNKATRRKYSLRMMMWPSGGGNVGSPNFFQVLKECAVQGFQLMLVDVAVQMSTSVTNYMAASDHFETAFKLGAAESAFWSFGPQYLMPTMMVVKIFGSKIIAGGQYEMFIRLYSFATLIAACLAITAIFVAAMKADFVAYDYGSSACVYASQPGCASAYASIFFQDGNGLDSMFDVFGPTVGLNLFFVIFRTGLMACHDFACIAKGAVGSVFLVYVPAILLAKFMFKTALSYYIAMYAPHVALLFVFGRRMWMNIQCMRNGQEGPWTAHVRKMTRGSSLDESLLGVDQQDKLLTPYTGGAST